ncbi:hypothetical protein ACHAPT_010214 [Fusarium lateritium]
MGKNKNKKSKSTPAPEKTDPNDRTLVSHNAVLTDNTISERRVLDQVQEAPKPEDKGKSGYPHQYHDMGGLFRTRTNSSTTAYYEYPVTQSGPPYDFASKPKDNPGPYRAVTNQNQTYKGTMCHDGDAEKNNANAGFFHLCEPKEE